MKIILVVTRRNNSVLNIDRALCSLGHSVSVVWSDDFMSQSSYLDKKMDDFGVHHRRRKYELECKNILYRTIERTKPDAILWINPPALITYEEFVLMSNSIEQIAWFVDSIRGHDELIRYFRCMGRIGVFELQDLEYLHGLNIDPVLYCPIGYNEAYENYKPMVKVRDIVFIGSPFKNRLYLLNKIAELSAKNNYKLVVYGPFWEKRYFWKKWIFRYNYPRLYSCVKNGTVTSDEAAEIYMSSKICLNIHDEKHKSPNPRTFEILACGSFELCDVRDNYLGELIPPKAFDVFSDEEDLQKKLTYYLANEKKREKIAEYGRKHNIYSIKYSLQKLLNA